MVPPILPNTDDGCLYRVLHLYKYRLPIILHIPRLWYSITSRASIILRIIRGIVNATSINILDRKSLSVPLRGTVCLPTGIRQKLDDERQQRRNTVANDAGKIKEKDER